MKMINKLITLYWRATAGALAVGFAVMAPVLMGSVGMVVDLAQANHVKQRLCSAVDASALAGAATSADEDEITPVVENFFDANYPDEAIGVPGDVAVSVGESTVTVMGTAVYHTKFMGVLGQDTMNVKCRTVVNRDVRGLEVALVLDNTGSMSTNNNIGTLRTAATNFTNILFEKASDPEFIKIGLVPYSTAVNVGSYGICEYPNGDPIPDCEPFVNLPEDLEYTSSYYSSDWFGCVLAYNDDVVDDSWDPENMDHDPYPYDTSDLDEITWEGEGVKWQIYRYEVPQTTCTNYQRVCYGWYCYNRCTAYDTEWETYQYPNQSCVKSTVLPLTNNQDDILDHIGDMQASGWTLGNIGMVWGYRMISPQAPFIAQPWDEPKWRKVIIMMTDGINTFDDYTAYWRDEHHSITTNDLNERFLETCNNIKGQGEQETLIYTITFESGVDESTKEYYRNCATSEAHYYDAPSQDELVEVFEGIANELSILHISE